MAFHRFSKKGDVTWENVAVILLLLVLLVILFTTVIPWIADELRGVTKNCPSECVETAFCESYDEDKLGCGAGYVCCYHKNEEAYQKSTDRYTDEEVRTGQATHLFHFAEDSMEGTIVETNEEEAIVEFTPKEDSVITGNAVAVSSTVRVRVPYGKNKTVTIAGEPYTVRVDRFATGADSYEYKLFVEKQVSYVVGERTEDTIADQEVEVRAVYQLGDADYQAVTNNLIADVGREDTLKVRGVIDNPTMYCVGYYMGKKAGETTYRAINDLRTPIQSADDCAQFSLKPFTPSDYPSYESFQVDIIALQEKDTCKPHPNPDNNHPDILFPTKCWEGSIKIQLLLKTPSPVTATNTVKDIAVGVGEAGQTTACKDGWNNYACRNYCLFLLKHGNTSEDCNELEQDLCTEDPCGYGMNGCSLALLEGKQYCIPQSVCPDNTPLTKSCMCGDRQVYLRDQKIFRCVDDTIKVSDTESLHDPVPVLPGGQPTQEI